MVNINWQFQATIPGGPSLILNQPTISAEAYDIVSLILPASTSSVVVPIQPSSTPGDVVLLVVSSSQYPGVTYTVDALPTSYVLDGPHILVGSGALSFLNNTAPPQKLTFDNTLTKEINVQIMVGRKVP